MTDHTKYPFNAPFDYMVHLASLAPEDYSHYDEELWSALQPLLDLYASDTTRHSLIEENTMGRFARACAMAVQHGLAQGRARIKNTRMQEQYKAKDLDHAVQLLLDSLSAEQREFFASIPQEEVAVECACGMGQWVRRVFGLGTDRANGIYRHLAQRMGVNLRHRQTDNPEEQLKTAGYILALAWSALQGQGRNRQTTHPANPEGRMFVMDWCFRTRKPKTCPLCGSPKVAGYLYGEPMPTREQELQLKFGSLVIGGCCREYGAPRWRCMDCPQDLYLRSQMEFTRGLVIRDLQTEKENDEMDDVPF